MVISGTGLHSAVILVGGAARRVNGLEKYFFRLDGMTFIERLIRTLRPITGDIVLVARDPAQCERFGHLPGIHCVTDIRQGIGPIGGLHAGVRGVKGESFFVCACDMPCVDGRVVTHLFSRLGSYDAAIPEWQPGMIEPLHAVYRARPLLAELEDPAHFSLRDVVHRLNTRFVPMEEIRRIDPDLRTFTNINKIEDLERLNGYAGSG